MGEMLDVESAAKQHDFKGNSVYSQFFTLTTERLQTGLQCGVGRDGYRLGLLSDQSGAIASRTDVA